MRKVYKLIPAVVAALAASKFGSTASGQVLYEPFNYANGANITTNANTGSIAGYTGQTNAIQGTTWARTAATGIVTRNWTVDTTQSLANPNLPNPRGGVVVSPTSGTSGTEVDRMSLGENITSANTTIYYSFSIKVNDVTNITAGGLRLLGFGNFSNNADTALSSLGGSLVIASPAAGQWRLGTSKNSGTAGTFTIDTNNTYSTGQTVFVVGSYNILSASNTTDDTSSMWASPSGATYGAAAAPGSTVGPNNPLNDITDGNGTPDAALPQIASFFLRNTANLGFVVDDLRVDTTWAGVTPRNDLQYAWTSASGGNLSDASWTTTNGTLLTPNSLGAVANFGFGTPIAAGNITTAGQTIDTIDISNANPLNINGTGLTISTNASAGQIIVEQGNHTVSAPLTLSSNLDLKVAGGSTLTMGGSITGSGKTIDVFGTGSVKMGGTDLVDHSSILNVLTGTLDLNGNNVTVAQFGLGAASANNNATANGTTVGGPTIAFGTLTGSGTLNAATFLMEAGNASANLAGTTLTKLHGGTVTLSGTNAITGTMTVRDGTLIIGSNGAASGGSSAIQLVDSGSTASGVTLEANSGVTVARDMAVGVSPSAPTATIGGATAGSATFSGNLTLNHAVRLIAQPSGTALFSGAVSEGTAGMNVQKVGSGMVVLSNTNNTYTGTTTVLAGTLLATNTGALPGFNATGKLAVNTVAGSTLAVSAGGAGQWMSGDIDTAIANTTFQDNTMNFGINVDGSNSFTYGSNVTAAIGFVKLGAGTLTFSGNNSYTGTTTISGGTLVMTNPNSLGATSGSTVNINDSTLRFGAGFDVIAGQHVFNVGGSGGTIDLNGNTTPAGWSATINGAPLTITGSGEFNSTGPINQTALTISGGARFTALNDSSLGTVSGSPTVTLDNGTLGFNSDGVTSNRTLIVTPNGGTVTTQGRFGSGTVHPENITWSGSVTGSGALTHRGQGSLTVQGSMSGFTGGVSVIADTLSNNMLGGTLRLQTNLLGAASVSVSGPSSVLELASGGGNNRVIKTPTVTATTGGQVNLQDNKMIVTNAGSLGALTGSTYSGVTGLIQAGRNGGAWNGTGIVSSQSSASGSSALTTLAVDVASDTGKTSLGGVPVSPTDTLVMYTYAGDMNLDGKINGDDYFKIDSAFGTSASGYANGDLNYDGRIDADDYFIIDKNYSEQTTQFASGAPVVEGVAAVPEPASLAMLVLAGMGLRRRRRS